MRPCATTQPENWQSAVICECRLKKRLRAILPNAAYFSRRELCSPVPDTDFRQKRRQNPTLEGRIEPKTNETRRRVQLYQRRSAHCIVSVAKSMPHWALVPAAPRLISARGRREMQ